MVVNICIDKTELAEPHFIRQTIEEHRRWRDIRQAQDLPVGALDNAIRVLEQSLALAEKVYIKELNA